ncbi:MAG: pyruvate carboxylase [Eubacteriales bacterium]|nr:pyruvate carboxylase [Eubacteriales bacterium]
MKKFKKVLVANRGEIAIRIMRACKELGIRTVAIYSEEDKNALFRTKADEAYKIGVGKSPVDVYLGIDEIIDLAKAKGCDAIHPGYGFLAENSEFAKQCEANGIEFIGPTGDMMDKLGDKIQSKILANSVGVQTIPGVKEAIKSNEDAVKFAEYCGYPVMIKAAAGGGGRGMRVVRDPKDLIPEFNSAQSESLKAFGSDEIFIEKYVEDPKHIEVQVLGDKYGNLVHMYERDCSIQRRHQKVIEFTPAQTISEKLRQEICNDALKIAQAVNYRSAGTVEFLVDKNENHYFIEMNPRIQVEHTVTELVTEIDIVQSQILIAEGYALNSPEINIPNQDAVQPRGAAIQCRITTEDPANQFAPDTGKIDFYATGSGNGVRLDGGNGFTGAVITPYYDSLLVKITCYGRDFKSTVHKSIRALNELTIRGVKTNRNFLLNVLNHPQFLEGSCTTNFIADNPQLLNVDMTNTDDDEVRVLKFLGNKAVNEVKWDKPPANMPEIPDVDASVIPTLRGTKQIFDERGPEGLSKWVLEQKQLLFTDTTMRDAQQSLMATRMRTIDLERIADATAVYGKDLFSLEMWGGATFDTCLRFLKEDPWERLELLRKRIPNILMQMLLRGSNAVGYKSYPDNVLKQFIKESAKGGIDVFRIFDSLNWIESMRLPIDEVRSQGKIAEATMCYTGDILDPTREKYNLNYYIKKAKELEKAGANIIAIKDMSSLLKPMAAYKLIKELKQEVGVPIHLHTHDTSGNGGATLMTASMAGVDIVDAAFDSMAGLTSQPPLNSTVAALEHTDRATGMNIDELQTIANYWSGVRPVYAQFESELKNGSAEIYKYEMPGGQYSNFRAQVNSFGLGHKFQEVKEMYRQVNLMLGDIIKVTPSSKVVGDMAIFMVQNGLTPQNIYEKGQGMDFPDSVVSYFEGMMGQPEGGFPEKLRELVLKGKPHIDVRPGTLLQPEDFDAVKKHLHEKFGIEPTEQDLASYNMYPKVFEDYLTSLKKEGSFRYMDSDVFFHGIKLGETVEIELNEGKTLVVKFVDVSNPDENGNRQLTYQVNGLMRTISIKDKQAMTSVQNVSIVMADEDDEHDVGANIPGNIVKVVAKEGDEVAKGDPIAVIEAMKMETKIIATMDGIVDKIYISQGDQVKSGQLVAKLREKEEA